MKHRNCHQRQTDIGHGAASLIQALTHMAPTDIGGGEPPHIRIAPPVLPGPAERLFDFPQELPLIGRIGLQTGKISAVHLLGVLPAEPVEVDLVFHLLFRENRIILLQSHEVALDQRSVYVVDPLVLRLAALSSLNDHISVPINVGKITPPEIAILVPTQADDLCEIDQPPIFRVLRIGIRSSPQAWSRRTAFAGGMGTPGVWEVRHDQPSPWKRLAERRSSRVNGAGRSPCLRQPPVIPGHLFGGLLLGAVQLDALTFALFVNPIHFRQIRLKSYSAMNILVGWIALFLHPTPLLKKTM